MKNQRLQRAEYLTEYLKKRAISITDACSHNKADTSFISFPFLAVDQISSIVIELVEAVELQGRVEAIAREMSDKSGISV